MKFEFEDERWTSLTKKALFTLKNGRAIEMSVINDMCDLPVEIFEEVQEIIFGVYGFDVVGNDLLLRLSPYPKKLIIEQGSYKQGVETEEITPSQFEQYMSAMNNILLETQQNFEQLQTLENAVEANEEERVLAENERKEAETQRNIDTENAINRIVDMTEEYNSNALEKFEQYNTNAENKFNSFNDNAEIKLNNFNDNAETKTNEFNTNVIEKETEVENLIIEMASSIEFATFEIDLTDGEMYINKTERLGNMGFSINQESGELEVEING